METQSSTPQTTNTPTPSSAMDPRTYVILMHVSQFIGLLIPFGSIIAPLILWAMKRTDSTDVDEHGKEILNFQISYSIYTLISIVLIIVLIGILLAPIVVIAELVFVTVGIVNASNGKLYRYPLTIRFIK